MKTPTPCRVFPTSALVAPPSDRLADIQELLAAGFISKEDGMKLLDFPDLQQFYKFNNSGSDDIDRTIELIVEKRRVSKSRAISKFRAGIIKMQQTYLYYKTVGLGEMHWNCLEDGW